MIKTLDSQGIKVSRFFRDPGQSIVFFFLELSQASASTSLGKKEREKIVTSSRRTSTRDDCRSRQAHSRKRGGLVSGPEESEEEREGEESLSGNVKIRKIE